MTDTPVLWDMEIDSTPSMSWCYSTMAFPAGQS